MIKKLICNMKDEEVEETKSWNNDKWKLWLEWVREENYRKIENSCSRAHNNKCTCVYCKVYKNRIRKKCSRKIRRKRK